MCVKTNNEGGEPPRSVQQQLQPTQGQHQSQQQSQPQQSQVQQQTQLQQQMQLQHLQLQHQTQQQQHQQSQQHLTAKRRKPLDDLSAAVVGDCKRNRILADSQEFPESQENQFPSLAPSLTHSPPLAHQPVTQTMPEDLIIPSPPTRRRSLLMWNPRLRGKDERRKVLKISISKLRLIDDPEVFLRRSVLVNNTLKKLQKEIRDERSSQRFYDVRNPWRPVAEETCLEAMEPPSKRRRETEAERLESSDEEIFGVSSDVVRVSVPKPTGVSSSSSSSSSSESEDESAEQMLHNSGGFNCQTSPRDSKEQSSVTCASQFRRLEDSVSVLDSVVYHSLIASLES
ncbi:uncharacterized protein LOC100905019 [Galendromus occidentalis]|uniref:Uncharacterized protein LOC100905019 n=1 Tax=Galendromus occidentalis TaxID=34638 RepID=A0AAJ6QZ43_9ACAR|nr:uncharacterized protein LOC100905019 [Galendromus occidentalis]